MTWETINTGGGCTALAIEAGPLRLLATWEGVALPREGEAVWLSLELGNEMVSTAVVPWAEWSAWSAAECLGEMVACALSGEEVGA